MFGHLTYLILELGWATPILALHWLIGWRYLRPRLGLLAFAVLLPTAYLTAADGVALREGIWSLHDARILGLRPGGIPVEEGIFFLLTNLLVAQTVILLVCSRPAQRGAGEGPRGEALEPSLERTV